MKRNFIIACAAAMALSASAQSFTVYKTTGDRISFNTESIERIEFSTTSIGDNQEFKTLPFNNYLTSVSPEEGIVDLEVTPLGLGRINIEMKGVYQVNPNSKEEITLSTPTETVFSRRPDAEGMYVRRNIMSGTTTFEYVFNVDGFTTPGIYNLYIPKGVYTDTQENPLGGTARVFILQTPPQSQAYTASPVPGSIVEKIGSVKFKYANYSVVELNAGAKTYVMKEGSTLPEAMPTPTIGTDGTVTISFPEITEPGTYIVKVPAATFTLREEAGAKGYESEEITMAYMIEGAVQVAPKVGDFYYSDGTWSTTLIDRPGVDPIGVIFYLGAAKEGKDQAAFYTQKDGKTPMEEFHGYVVALRDATQKGTANEGVVWHKWDPSEFGTGTSTDISDHLGYTNTKAAVAYAEKNYGGLSDSSESLPAVYYATAGFEAEVPAPAQSSGWFLPSAGQLKYIWDRVYFDPNTGAENPAYVEKSLKALAEKGGTEMHVRNSNYWSSTEQLDAYGKCYRAYYMTFDASLVEQYQGSLTWSNKHGEYRVRSILAF